MKKEQGDMALGNTGMGNAEVPPSTSRRIGCDVCGCGCTGPAADLVAQAKVMDVRGWRIEFWDPERGYMQAERNGVRLWGFGQNYAEAEQHLAEQIKHRREQAAMREKHFWKLVHMSDIARIEWCRICGTLRTNGVDEPPMAKDAVREAADAFSADGPLLNAGDSEDVKAWLRKRATQCGVDGGKID